MKKGADLVSLTTDEENNFVYSHTKNFPYAFWIGLRYTNTTNPPWAWSNGEKLGIMKWNDGEPNNIPMEHCVQILKRLNFWNNKECDEYLPWICEKLKAIKRQSITGIDNIILLVYRGIGFEAKFSKNNCLPFDYFGQADGSSKIYNYSKITVKTFLGQLEGRGRG